MLLPTLYSPTKTIPPLLLHLTPWDTIQNLYGIKAHPRDSCGHCSYDTSQHQSYAEA